MSSGFNTSDPLALDHPGVASWLASLATVTQELADAQDEAGLLTLLARVTLPALGDLCALYILDAGGVIRPVLAPVSTSSSAAERLHAYEAQSDGATDGYARLVLDGRVVSLTEIAPDWLDALAQTPEHLTLLKAVGLTSAVFAPLATRGRAIGLLLIGSTGRARPYADGALTLIQMLAARVASTLAVRELERREAALQGRLDELIRAARELAHLVNNDLTLPVGTLEILLDRPDHPAELREMLAAAASDLSAAEHHIRGFHRLARGETTPSSERHSPPPPASGPTRT
jgi:GAF domain-containing protein